MTRKTKLAFRLMTEEEVAESEAAEPIPIFCAACQDSGYVRGESIFVNTEHSYGVEYLGAPCPHCELGAEVE